MPSIIIDGKKLQAENEATVLDVARNNNIYIPTLCVNDAVAPYGACRLCMVEITRRGRTKLVASCLYPVQDGLEVKTDSERIRNVRQMVMELLLARCPQDDEVKALAGKLGVTETRFKIDDEENHCVLCAMCTRVCKEVVGRSAISLVNRGTEREVAIPFYDNTEACIACGSCAYICPTSAITLKDTGGKRIITMPNCRLEFKMKKCSGCGSYWAPEKQIKFMAEKARLPLKEYDFCPNCKD